MHLTTATSIKYGDYKYLKCAADDIHTMIKKHWKSLCKAFDFDRDVEIRIRPIRGNTYGLAYDKENRIEIEPRSNPRDVLEIVAHELVHMEQYKQKRLRSDYTGRFYWNKKAFKPSKTHEEYLNEPWEIEARARAEKYINKVWPLK